MMNIYCKNYDGSNASGVVGTTLKTLRFNISDPDFSGSICSPSTLLHFDRYFVSEIDFVDQCKTKAVYLNTVITI